MDVNKMLRDTQKKAETFLKDHHDQLESGVSKAETFAKGKSKSPKRDAQIDKVANTLRGLIPSDQPKDAKAKRPEQPKPGGGGEHHQPNNMHTDNEPGASA